MTKQSKIADTSDHIPTLAEKVQPDVKATDIEVTDSTPVHETIQSLMPELEDLVKKNPNRLIGCGG
jgi:hypothetical protein